MRGRRGPLVVALAAAGALFVHAAAPLSAQTSGEPGVVVKVSPATVAPGGKSEAMVTVEIQKGYRIVAPPVVMRYTQPALLAFDAADGVFVESVTWPDATAWRGEPEDPQIKVYEGRVEIKVLIRAAPNAPRQEIALQGRLRYQPIKYNAFEKVSVMPVSLPLKVGGPPAPAGPPATRR